jgi:CheY-like chemotaxis protein
MDGAATLAALRGIPSVSGVPVIFVTARARPEEADGFRRLGAAGVITKPFDPVALSDQVRTLWEKARRAG